MCTTKHGHSAIPYTKPFTYTYKFYNKTTGLVENINKLKIVSVNFVFMVFVCVCVCTLWTLCTLNSCGPLYFILQLMVLCCIPSTYLITRPYGGRPRPCLLCSSKRRDTSIQKCFWGMS